MIQRSTSFCSIKNSDRPITIKSNVSIDKYSRYNRNNCKGLVVGSLNWLFTRNGVEKGWQLSFCQNAVIAKGTWLGVWSHRIPMPFEHWKKPPTRSATQSFLKVCTENGLASAGLITTVLKTLNLFKML